MDGFGPVYAKREETQVVSNLIATTQIITVYVLQGWHIETMMDHPTFLFVCVTLDTNM